MNQDLIEGAKMELLQSVLDTDRGSSALIEKRAIIEEAMVCCNAMQCKKTQTLVSVPHDAC
jgi:hypothetical protein